MLLELAVSGLGVIDDLTLVPSKGMTALTGETGAGKTLVVEALELLLGGRADPALVGPSADAATVEGRFLVGDEEVVLCRVLPGDGRSRAYLNGRMATAGALAEVADGLVDLHGQHSHQSLLAPAVQRAALDRFGRVELGRLHAARGALAETDAALSRLGGDQGAREREADLLRFQRDELDAAGLADPDEDLILEAEEDRLADAVGHQEAATLTTEALSADGPVADAIGRARVALARRAPFSDVADRVAALEAELADVATEVRAVGESIDHDPARLELVRERRQQLRDLVRKYGTAALPGGAGDQDRGAGDLAAVIAYQRAVDHRIGELERHEESSAALEGRRAEQVAAVAAAEDEVRVARKQAAPRLAAAVEGHLADLAMDRARVEVSVGGRGPGDEVDLLLAANPGSSALPLRKAASGGELARAMLALRLVLTAAPSTLVFDEVDAGIGGEAARSVGRALAELAADHQVLVVTHLPQVAAFADAHIAVTKHVADGATSARATVVDGGERLTELARMLSGAPDSETARQHAADLLRAASEERSG